MNKQVLFRLSVKKDSEGKLKPEIKALELDVDAELENIQVLINGVNIEEYISIKNIMILKVTE